MLSPILFTIYIDDLLDDLRNRGVGCFWDSVFADAMGYADDVILLAPSPAALRIMLHCCEDFAFERGLQFNPSKTQLIRFSWSSSSSCTARFNFCGQQLSFLDTVTHLGHLLHYNLSDVPDINHKLRNMVKKANCLLASFPRVGPIILTRLFQSYCLSLYGSALWTLSCPALYHLEVAFNKILRKIWHLPYRSHTQVLFIWLLILIVSIILSFVRPILFCLQLLSVPLFWFSQSFFDLPPFAIVSVVITQGSRHLKQYDIQYRLCASGSLRSCSHPDCDCEQMIQTISCD